MCTYHPSSDAGTLNCHESWNFIMLLFPQKKSMHTIDSLRKSGNFPFGLTHAKNMKHLKSHLIKGLLFADTKLSQLYAFLPLFSQHLYEATQYYSPCFTCGETEHHRILWLGHGLQAYTSYYFSASQQLHSDPSLVCFGDFHKPHICFSC